MKSHLYILIVIFLSLTGCQSTGTSEKKVVMQLKMSCEGERFVATTRPFNWRPNDSFISVMSVQIASTKGVRGRFPDKFLLMRSTLLDNGKHILVSESRINRKIGRIDYLFISNSPLPDSAEGQISTGEVRLSKDTPAFSSNETLYQHASPCGRYTLEIQTPEKNQKKGLLDD